MITRQKLRLRYYVGIRLVRLVSILYVSGRVIGLQKFVACQANGNRSLRCVLTEHRVDSDQLSILNATNKQNTRKPTTIRLVVQGKERKRKRFPNTNGWLILVTRETFSDSSSTIFGLIVAIYCETVESFDVKNDTRVAMGQRYIPYTTDKSLFQPIRPRNGIHSPFYFLLKLST